MSDAGGMGHGSVNSSVERRIGRSEAYRRRVALDTRLAAGAKDQFATTASIYGP
jgi:hypothetical protein